VLEKDIDKRFVDSIKKRGWLSRKLTPYGYYGTKGDPDRQIILPGEDGPRYFEVELKTTTGKVSAAQQYRHEVLAHFGVEVNTVYGVEEALAILDIFEHGK